MRSSNKPWRSGLPWVRRQSCRQSRNGLAALLLGALLAAVAASSAGPRAAPSAAALFPLQTGNEWVFQSESTGDSRAIRCESAQGAERRVAGLFERELLLVYSGRGRDLDVRREGGSRTDPFLLTRLRRWRFNLSSGACDTFQARRAEEPAPLETPAGTFSRTHRVEFTLRPEPNVRCIEPDIHALWFARGVGPVRLESRGGEIYTLVSARVDGRVYP